MQYLKVLFMPIIDNCSKLGYYTSMAKVNFNHLKLKSIIVGAGLQYRQITDPTGISPSTFSKWMIAASRPDPENLYRVLRVCGWRDDDIRAMLGEFYYPPVDEATQ